MRNVPLRQPESIAESRLPAHVQRLARPQPLGRAVSLAFLRWEKQSLAETERFWRDFGLAIAHASDARLVARGTGTAPCIAIAQRGERTRFVGAAFAMSGDTDLEVYVRTFGARRLDAREIPGGGLGVELFDPAGRPVWLLQGQAEVDALPNREPITRFANSPSAQPRVNATVRTPIEPARVVRLGHFVLQAVDFNAVAHWYIRVLGLIPTDVQYVADGSPALAFCRLDLRDTPADHHTVVFVAGIEDRYEHSAYEVVDLDAVGQGQQVLRAAGWRHMWGMGRHLLGSQVFDYWFDPDGFEVEHYADGDVFTADFETCYSPLDFGGIWAWGADAPASMKPGKNLRTLLTVLKLLRQRRITPERLKLLAAAADAPARPWL